MSAPAAFLLGVFAALSVSGLRSLRRMRARRERIKELTAYLEAVNWGEERVLSRREDELSLLEDEIAKTVGELRIAKERERSARKRQADNLADIAHQLKTPITSMLLMTDLLSGEASASQEECLHRLTAQIQRLERLTSALLMMSKLDAGAIEFQAEEARFSELAARASEPVDGLIRERKQRLIVRNEDCPVRCDILWTAEALLNIIKNCSEQAGEGGNIQASCEATPLYTQITIEDDGPGFLERDIPRLFQRFYRGTGAAPGSIGIGLALSRAIIEGQGGLIHAENRREGGARFVIRLYPVR